MLTVLLFIVVISVLVFVHELGHFVTAKRSGMKVEEFGFGFPPRLWGFKKGETVYSVNWIPFGGFVKIFGEDGEERSASRSFSSKSIRTRMGVVLAGVLMNFIFAALLLTLGNYFGLRIGLFESKDILAARDKTVVIIGVSEDSPAKQVDLRILDEIRGFQVFDNPMFGVTGPADVQNYINQHIGDKITMVIKRGSQILNKEVSLRLNPPAGQGPLGVSMALTGVVSYPWYVAIWKGFYDAIILTLNTVNGFYSLLKNLVINRQLIADVSGPIGIVTLTGQAAQVGFSYLMQFVAMISINLAVLNIVPFPALDGGRALMLVIEKFRRRPLPRKTEAMINTAGFFVLISLMLIITARDLSKLF